MGKTILHLMGMDSTKYGGLEKYNVELARQLLQKGYNSVFVYEDYPDVKQYTDDLTSVNAQIIVINSRRSILKFCVNFWKLLKKYDFSIMHAHFTKARFYAIPLALVFGMKNILYTLHSRIDTLSKIKLHTRLWYWLMNRYCKVVAVSKQIEKIAKINWININCQALYLGVNQIHGDKIASRELLYIPLDQLVLTCIANFNHIKGLDVLVKAIKSLVDDGHMNNSKFYIVGQPENDRIELQRLIDELHISNYIQLVGIKNNIQQYLLASDIYIQPSRSEGLPLSLMEACSAGLPIVASRVGGIPEVAIENRNSLLFESENEEDLAKKICKLIDDSEQRKMLGIQSKKVYNEHFSIQTNVTKLIEYYHLD